jgi:hypothetical protein
MLAKPEKESPLRRNRSQANGTLAGNDPLASAVPLLLARL